MRQKKERVDIPAEGPVAIPTPRAPRETTARPTPHMIGVRESATPAPGGGPGLVWVNTKLTSTILEFALVRHD